MASETPSLPPTGSTNSTMTAYTTSFPSLPLPPLSPIPSTIPRPIPTPTQLLIKITHASLTPGGVILQALLPAFMHTYSSIPELDFAGRVVGLGAEGRFGGARVAGERGQQGGEDGREEMGEEQEDREKQEGFKLGDQVFGSIPITQHLAGAGALAEYVSVDASCLSHIPMIQGQDESSVERQISAAASLPVSGCTALDLLRAAKLAPGMHILINGASGGVGSLILQMAKHAVGTTGTITAVCSERNSEFVKELGADCVVAYDKLELGVGAQIEGLCISRARKLAVAGGKVLSAGNEADDGKELTNSELDAGKFDVVIDAVGKQEIWHSCPSFLKSGGAYVTVGPGMEDWTRMAMVKTLGQMAGNMLIPTWLGGVARRYVQVASTVDKEGLRELKGMVEEGVLRGVVERVWGWDKVGEAYGVMLSRRARGKIVIKVEQ